MKQVIILLLLLGSVSCGSRSIKKDKTLPPDTEITEANAKDVTSFDNTPGSVVMYFYASRIRKDNDWEKVCLPANARTDKFKRGLEEYENWTFTKYRLVDQKEFEKNRYWVKIYMSISVDGETDDGEDEATVELIDGQWLITEVPT